MKREKENNVNMKTGLQEKFLHKYSQNHHTLHVPLIAIVSTCLYSCADVKV